MGCQQIEDYEGQNEDVETKEEKSPNLLVDLKAALMSEFRILWTCSRVDLRFMWAGEDKKARFRINGWIDERVVFSRFVIGWKGDKGVQYKIVG